jgi:hypothetical protein
MTDRERYEAIREAHWNEHEQCEHGQIVDGVPFRGHPRLCYEAGFDAGYAVAKAEDRAIVAEGISLSRTNER